MVSSIVLMKTLKMQLFMLSVYNYLSFSWGGGKKPHKTILF